MGEGWGSEVKAQSQPSLGKGVSGLQPEKQKNEQQAVEGPGKPTADRWGRIAKLMSSRLLESGLLLYQALISEVQHPQTRSSYALAPKGSAFPGLTSGGPTSPRYDLPWFHFSRTDLSVSGSQVGLRLRRVP